MDTNIEFTENEKILLNKAKSAGVDNFSPRTPKSTRAELASLHSQIMVEPWTRANVEPYFKSGSRKQILRKKLPPNESDHRPPKIMNRILRKRFTKFLIDNDKLSDNQCGFLWKR